MVWCCGRLTMGVLNASVVWLLGRVTESIYEFDVFEVDFIKVNGCGSECSMVIAWYMNGNSAKRFCE